MQQKKYSFNYLIFKQGFIKRRMLVNPVTHPVGVSVSEQTIPQCDQQVDNAVPALRRSCNIQAGKLNRATTASKLFPMASPKVCCACFWACSERFSPRICE
ncbi:Uncharacterised protein [Escherichia coli]|uniref:Uncharacterized protein n=1 Tax=Escherichia coli TaxID=562 RepID=A0A376YEX1_ECOLX|nr:Uncharacterised protein [Escherichia coli]